jgi:hypothetical protein
MNRQWNNEQEQFIKDYAHAYSDKQLTLELNTRFSKNFSISATRKKRQRLLLTKEGHRSFFRLKAPISPEDTII